jgi:hypothetical protein
MAIEFDHAEMERVANVQSTRMVRYTPQAEHHLLVAELALIVAPDVMADIVRDINLATEWITRT